MDLFVERASIPYGELSNFSALFTDYCADFGNLDSYFGGDFRSDSDFASTIDSLVAGVHQRERLADVLVAQNKRWQSGALVARQIERLRQPDCVAVVTGQQLGLFGGPLYTIYKAITAIQLAGRLEKMSGKPVVPVFWLEGEDHDLEEAGQVSILKGNEPVTFRYPGADGNRVPVGRLVLSGAIGTIIDGIEDALPPTEHRESVVSLLRDCYREGVSFYDAFARFMSALFQDSGLIFVKPDDPELKAIGAPLFAREIKTYQESGALLTSSGDALEQKYHAQVRTTPLNLFLFEEGERRAVDVSGSHFVLRGTDRRFSETELLALLDASPELFSPNVALRPLLQDTVLPTVAYVAGPGEVAYFAQFKTLYDWSETTMPIIFPRLSASLVEGKIRKVLDRYGISVGALGGDGEVLFRRLVEGEMEVDLEAMAEKVSRNLKEAFTPLADAAARIDPTLKGSAAAIEKNIQREVDRFRGKILKAEKRKHETIAAQIAKASESLYPFGKPQERVLSVLQYLTRYGTGFVRSALETLPEETSRHHILYL